MGTSPKVSLERIGSQVVANTMGQVVMLATNVDDDLPTIVAAPVEVFLADGDTESARSVAAYHAEFDVVQSVHQIGPSYCIDETQRKSERDCCRRCGEEISGQDHCTAAHQSCGDSNGSISVCRLKQGVSASFTFCKGSQSFISRSHVGEWKVVTRWSH